MILAIGMVLDAVLGEPKWLWDRMPHPAVVMGRLIGWLDRTLNSGNDRKSKGILVIAGLTLGAWLLGLVLSELPDLGVIEIAIVAILLAQKSLVDHVAQVARALETGLEDGRQAVAQIVGRDVDALDRSGVARSAIESAAENLSDGVIAPALAYLILGLPGLIAYKIINTADSMIGYRTERHEEFGWASARLDDLVNWLPARLTAGLILLAKARPDLWRLVLRDARLHRSPNAGWPEAAMAGVLDVALSGPRSYNGVMGEQPFVHARGQRDLGPEDIRVAVTVLWQVWALMLGLCVLANILT